MNPTNQVKNFFYPEQLTPLQQSNALNDLQQQLQSMQSHITKLYDKIAKQQIDIDVN
jgi:TolA-binding protein